MSLIADSLKKAQKERDRDKEQLERNIIRSSILPGFSQVLKKAAAAFGWALILLGGWFTLFIPSQDYQATTKPLILAKAKKPVTAPAETLPQPVVPANSTSLPTKSTSSPTTDTTSETIAPSGKTPKESVTQVAEVLPVTKTKKVVDASPEKTGEGISSQKTAVETQPVLKTRSKTKSNPKPKLEAEPKPKANPKPEPQVKAPLLAEQTETEEVPYEPFVKPGSALEHVAALTENLETEPNLEVTPHAQPETETISGETHLAQEVPVTSLLGEQGAVQEKKESRVLEAESNPVVDLSAENESVSGDSSISVVPNETDMKNSEKWKNSLDPRTLDDKSRYFNIASFHHRNGDYFEALKFYEKAKHLDPGNARIHNNRALIFKKLGRSQEAIRELLQAVRLDPTYVKAYNNLGLMYYLYGDPMSATRYFEKATEIDPRNIESYNNLAIIYKKQRHYRRAEMLYRKVINLDPKQPEGYYNLALLYEQTNRIPEAIQYYNQFVLRAQSSRPALTLKVRSHIEKLEEKS